MTNHLLYNKVEKNVDKTQLYPTPTDTIIDVLDYVFDRLDYFYSLMPTADEHFNIMDAGSFDGRWGYYFIDYLLGIGWNIKHPKVTNVELLSEQEVLDKGGNKYYYDSNSNNLNLFETDFIKNSWQQKYNIVVGNPPYGNEFKGFWKNAKKCLLPGGLIMWLLPTEYLNGQWRKNNVNTYLEHCISISKRIDFTAAGSPNRNYSFFVYNIGKYYDGYKGHII